MKTQSLIAFDTDRIKDYVFSTGKLIEIRGASALLDRLNREEMARLAGGTEIYAHGGSGLFTSPTEKADTAIRAVRKQYQDATAAATVTGVSVDLPHDFDVQSDLRPHWQRLSLKLRAAKDRNAEQATPVTHPFLQPCDSCGRYHAVEFYSELGTRQAQLCRSCLLKHCEDRQIKNEIPMLIGGELQPHRKRLWHRFVNDLQQANYPFDALNRPEDFDELGEQSLPNGYMGLIYADGDDMGRLLDERHSLKELGRFAKAVDESVYGALKQAILDHLQVSPGARSLPFDVLLLGGDDLIMATTAQAAVETALTVVERFPALAEQYCDERLSLSVAVVFAHVKFPIGSLLGLADSALKFAKKERAKRGLKEGLLNFLVVSSANHLDFGDYYKATFEAKYGGEIVRRTMRPYTATDMHGLIQAKRELAGAPRGKLEQLRSAVFKHRHQAMLEGLVALLRWRDKEQRQQIQRLVNEFAAGQTALFPWVQRGNTFYTPLLDLIELFDFIP